MIPRAENETTTLLKKALIAGWRKKGAEPGTAAEFAKALFLLEFYGIDCVAALFDLINATGEKPEPLDFTNPDTMISDLAHMGPAIYDFVVANIEFVTFNIAPEANPLVLAGLAATYGGVMPGATTFYLSEERQVIAPGDYVLERSQLDAIAAFPKPFKVVIEPTSRPDKLFVEAKGPVSIDDERWQKMVKLAGENHVPESEHSRLKGAGAGLNDND